MDAFPELFRSRPHGEQRILLVEDAPSPLSRIYEVHDSHGNAATLLGSELDSVLAWWTEEKQRSGDKHS
jgi:hypothetical protein